MSEEQIFEDRPFPRNPMSKVDFSKARFYPSYSSVVFVNGPDLSDTILPTKGGIFLVKDTFRVFSEMMRRIETEWQGPLKEWAKSLAKVYSIKYRPPMGIEQMVINPEYMAIFDGEEFTKEFVKILKKVMEEGRGEGQSAHF